MPLALPPYMTGYAYSDFMQTIGVDFGGVFAAAVVTALAVYPYIYLFARAALRYQSQNIQNAARLMGYSPLAAAWKISLPLARPAIMVGAALALMETLGDIAIAEHYGVRSLGFGVYDLWLNRNDVYAACRLATLLMLAIIGLLALEETGRKKQKYYAAQCDRRFACDNAPPLANNARYGYMALLLLPAAGGFFLPIGWFIKLALQTPADLWRTDFWEGLSGSLMLSFAVVITLLILALIFCADKRQNPYGVIMTPLAKLAQCGYALPGAILAQGVFLLAVFSDGIIAVFVGMSLLIAACAARFFIITSAAAEIGMAKISPQLDAAARLAKQTAWGILWRVHLPLMRPALITGALMTFLETIKELPMTLILRPLNFNTLSTIAYQYASDESPALAAPAILMTAAIATAAIGVLFWMEEIQKNNPII